MLLLGFSSRSSLFFLSRSILRRELSVLNKMLPPPETPVLSSDTEVRYINTVALRDMYEKHRPFICLWSKPQPPYCCLTTYTGHVSYVQYQGGGNHRIVTLRVLRDPLVTGGRQQK